MLVHQGLDGIAKYYNYKVGEDRFNFENESFQQSEDLVANDYSVNIPMIYYWKQKMHKGWIYNYKVGEDRFNFENESFQQSEDLVANDYSVNIPMIYYWKQKMHKGWINIINPFRGTIVLGTPGSGKSFGIIDPFIRQHAAKGFSMMVYDFKFPTLAKTLFYQYCKNMKLKKLPENCGFRIVNFTDVEYSFSMMVYDFKFPTLAKTLFYQYCKNMKLKKLPENCGFRIVNFTDVEYSNRINPIQRKYIPDLSAASETAATLLASLNKGGGEKKGGSEAFFTNSAENFLAAIIYFFVNFHPVGFKNGKKLKRYISGGGEKKGGSEAFFTNSAENFLAAIIYFFVNFHPVGFKNGKKLKRYISLAKEAEVPKEETTAGQSQEQQSVDASKEQSESQQQSESEEQTKSKDQTNSKEELPEGNKFELVIRNWDDYQAIDAKNNVILDFVDEKGNDVSTDEDRMFVGSTQGRNYSRSITRTAVCGCFQRAV